MVPSDFCTRNCSDFMRSLAAKYQSSQPNNSIPAPRIAFLNSSSEYNNFNSPVTTTVTSTGRSSNEGTANKFVINKSSSTCSSSTSIGSSLIACKENPNELAPSIVLASAMEEHVDKLQSTQNQIAAAAAAAVSVSPLMTFFSGLPFPPLLDMSSTQALITLARAAREAELQSIICSAQQQKRSTARASSLSLRSNLNAALQQAAKFVSPVFVSAQNQPQSAPIQPQPKSSSSPIQSSQSNVKVTNNNLLASETTTVDTHIVKDRSTPLDLSSQQPLPKRFKRTSSSHKILFSPFSGENMSANLTIRRTSTSSNTASITTSSPSPPTSLCSIPKTPTAAEVKPIPTTSTKDSIRNIAFKAISNSTHSCSALSTDINTWTVDDVCNFVGAIDICAEYMDCFREQRIDGTGLPLLTEDHLVKMLGMKLGPALKLRSILAKKLGGPCPCVTCVSQAHHMLVMQAAAAATTNSTSSNSSDRFNAKSPAPSSFASTKNNEDDSSKYHTQPYEQEHDIDCPHAAIPICHSISENSNNFHDKRSNSTIENQKLSECILHNTDCKTVAFNHSQGESGS